MTWRRKESGHQQPWYLLCWTKLILSSHIKGYLTCRCGSNIKSIIMKLIIQNSSLALALEWLGGEWHSTLLMIIQHVFRQWHDDIIKWKIFSRNWPFVQGIHRSPVNSPHKGQWRGALMFSLICVWINDWVNNREAGDLRQYSAHYDVIVMTWCH